MSKKENFKTLYAISLAWQLGFLIIIPIGGFLLLGLWGDKLLNTQPFFLITGILIPLFYYFENVGLKYTTVANTSLITSSIPMFTLLTAYFLFGKKLKWQNFVGIIFGISGIFSLFYKDILNSELHFKGDVLVFGSVIMWIFYSFSCKKIMNGYSGFFVIKKIFFYGFMFLIPVFIIEFQSFTAISWNPNVIINFVFLSLICSAAGYYFWNLAMMHIGVKITSNLILFIPIISILSGIVFLKEKFSINIIFAALLIISSSYLSSLTDTNQDF